MLPDPHPYFSELDSKADYVLALKDNHRQSW